MNVGTNVIYFWYKQGTITLIKAETFHNRLHILIIICESLKQMGQVVNEEIDTQDLQNKNQTKVPKYLRQKEQH